MRRRTFKMSLVAVLMACAVGASTGEDAHQAAVAAFERFADLAVQLPPRIRTADLSAYSTNKLDFALNNGLAISPGGRLWVNWISGGDGPGSFTVGNWSDDDGKTWTDVNLVIDGHDGTIAGRTNIIGTYWGDPEGRLHLFTDQSLLHFDGRAGVWESVCSNPDAPVPEWSVPRRIADGHLLNKPIIASDGTWFASVYNNGTWKSVSSSMPDAFAQLQRKVWCYASSDCGKTWEKRGTVEFPGRDWQETQLVEMKNGKLRVFARVHDDTGRLMVADSRDGGRTWSAPFSLVSMDNTNARFQVIRLASGRLLFVKHGPPAAGGKDGQGRSHLTAYLSDDDGTSWRGGLELDPGCGSYPDVCQSPDGVIYVTHDHGRGREAEIRLHKFTEEDILARCIVSSRGKLNILVAKAMSSKFNRRSIEKKKSK